MKVYVASSWGNVHQSTVVYALRGRGHIVYDFKDAEGFHWSEIDPGWKSWSPYEYIAGLKHPLAQREFNRNMDALRNCDVCVYVMPCGPNASMEMGWAKGAGKTVIAFVPELREADLMVKVADYVTSDLEEVKLIIGAL